MRHQNIMDADPRGQSVTVRRKQQQVGARLPDALRHALGVGLELTVPTIGVLDRQKRR